MKWVWLAIGVVGTIATVVTAGVALAAVGAFGPAAAGAVASAQGAVTAAAAGGAAVGIWQTILASGATATLTTAVLNTATAALALAGTAAQTVAAISNNEQAGEWAQYLALAAVGVGVVSGARSLASMAAKALRSPKNLDTASTLGGSISETMANSPPRLEGSRLQSLSNFRHSSGLRKFMGIDRFKVQTTNN